MQWFTNFQEWVLRIAYHPMQPHKKINFTEQLQQTRSVLVLCRETAFIPDYEDRLRRVFRNAEILFAVQTDVIPAENKPGIKIIFIPQSGLMKLNKSEAVHMLRKNKPDLFIDLDIAPDITAFYLSRLLQPKISLAFDKPKAGFYNNLLIRTQTYQPGPDRIGCVCDMLMKIMQKKPSGKGSR